MAQKHTSHWGLDTTRRRSGISGSVYKYKPNEIRCYAHEDILRIGSAIHQQMLEDLASEKKCIQETESAIWIQAELEMEKAVEKAIESLQKEQKNLEEKAERERKCAVQEAIEQTRKELEKYMVCELRKANEKSEQKLAKEIQKIEQRCNKEKMVAITEVIKQERKVACENRFWLRRTLMQQHREALEVAAKKHKKIMQELREEQHILLGLAVAVAQREEREKAQEQEIKHKEKLNEIITYVNDLKASQKCTEQSLESITCSKEELESELIETRQAFQKYIALTFPNLAPGQADFILPFRKKDLEDMQPTKVVFESS